MSETRDNGGPAFPCDVVNVHGYSLGPSMGMSLRDWFAGQALAGLAQVYHQSGMATGFLEHKGLVATYAYAVADAMLKARGEA